ncbi:MAG TPA: ABC transporter permease [Candidatus Angelobacter sp.]|nr:ABC transporter permease [Candidatus Angelobacter sp.]
MLERIQWWLSRRSRESSMQRELEAHIACEAEEQIDRGLDPAAAREAAIKAFGNRAIMMEDARRAWTWTWLGQLTQDLKYAFRNLRRSPGFTAVTIATLALGIGANAAIFSFVNAVLLKPLPYPHPEQIVSVAERLPEGGSNFISTLNFLDWERQNRCFQFLSAIAFDTVTLTGPGGPEELNVHRVSATYFKVLGVGATLGRTFAESEGEDGNNREVVLSNRIWRSRFGGDPKVIGREITLDAKNYTIIGVLQANSEFDRTWAVMWLPLTFTPATMTRNYHWLYAMARLAPGVTLKQARDQMDTIGARIAAAYPDSNKGWGVRVDPYIDQVVQPQLRRSLWVLLAAVGAVLLIGCANVANLTLARGTGRQHEIAVRSALGAGRLRLIRQLLTESIFLGILGGAVGLVLGDAFVHGMKRWLPPDILPPQANVRMDYGLLLLTMVIGILTGILCGLAPALNGTRPDLARSLNERGRTTAGVRPQRMRTILVVAEVALSFVLLAGASLLIRSFNRLASLNPGVDTTNVLAMDLPMPLTEFPNSTMLTNYLREVTQKVKSVPGVRDAAITDKPPMEGFANGAPFLIEGRDDLPYPQRPVCGFKVVGPSYFDTVGMRLLKGRSLDESDVAGTVPVTVINETMAKTYFKGEDPIGKRILIRQLVFGKAERGPDIPWQVVGVVTDEKVGGKKAFGLEEDIAVVYVTFYQSPGLRNSMVVRAATNPLLLSGSIEKAIWKVNSNQAVANIETLEEIKSQAVAPARLRTALLAIFAGIALLLAAIGISGVVSYSVAQRVREMAIRLALGASPGDLLKLVIGKMMLIVMVGLALGGGAALALTRVLASLLYATSPTDGVTWAVAGPLLAAVALLACYFPARRATKVDPLTILRFE